MNSLPFVLGTSNGKPLLLTVALLPYDYLALRSINECCMRQEIKVLKTYLKLCY